MYIYIYIYGIGALFEIWIRAILYNQACAIIMEQHCNDPKTIISRE